MQHIVNFGFSLLFYTLFVPFGMLYIGLGVLYFRAIYYRPSSERVQNFLSSLKSPISTLYCGAKGNVMFVMYSSLRNTSLLADLVQVQDANPVRKIIVVVFPIIMGALLISIPTLIFLVSLQSSENIARINSLFWLSIILISLYRAGMFGRRM
jgi:hypothetical protein